MLGWCVPAYALQNTRSQRWHALSPALWGHWCGNTTSNSSSATSSTVDGDEHWHHLTPESSFNSQINPANQNTLVALRIFHILKSTGKNTCSPTLLKLPPERHHTAVVSHPEAQWKHELSWGGGQLNAVELDAMRLASSLFLNHKQNY